METIQFNSISTGSFGFNYTLASKSDLSDFNVNNCIDAKLEDLSPIPIRNARA